MTRTRTRSTSHSERPLGRLEPTDFRHVERFPLAAVQPATIEHVERKLRQPGWRLSHDQGSEGSCVGHAVALERAMTNAAQERATGAPLPRPRYDPIDVWNEAKRIDEWPQTQPGDSNGTSLRAGYEVARVRGMVPVRTMRLDGEHPVAVEPGAVEQDAGVEVYRWATTVDEVRTAVAGGLPVAIGVNWYRAFDSPTPTYVYGPTSSVEHRLADVGKGEGLGDVRGGHALTITGASDRRQAVRLTNSWGRDYPLVWLPYATLERLLRENGEAALVTDR